MEYLFILGANTSIRLDLTRHQKDDASAAFGESFSLIVFAYDVSNPPGNASTKVVDFSGARHGRNRRLTVGRG